MKPTYMQGQPILGMGERGHLSSSKEDEGHGGEGWVADVGVDTGPGERNCSGGRPGLVDGCEPAGVHVRDE